MITKTRLLVRNTVWGMIPKVQVLPGNLVTGNKNGLFHTKRGKIAFAIGKELENGKT